MFLWVIAWNHDFMQIGCVVHLIHSSIQHFTRPWQKRVDLSPVDHIYFDIWAFGKEIFHSNLPGLLSIKVFNHWKLQFVLFEFFSCFVNYTHIYQWFIKYSTLKWCILRRGCSRFGSGRCVRQGENRLWGSATHLRHEEQ